MNTELPVLKIGMLGCGVVGGQVAGFFIQYAEELPTRSLAG